MSTFTEATSFAYAGTKWPSAMTPIQCVCIVHSLHYIVQQHGILRTSYRSRRVRPAANPTSVLFFFQDRVVSGVGNWVADEVCFQARVHPGATCNTLGPEQVRQGRAKKNVTLYTKSCLPHRRRSRVPETTSRVPCPSCTGYTGFPQKQRRRCWSGLFFFWVRAMCVLVCVSIIASITGCGLSPYFGTISLSRSSTHTPFIVARVVVLLPLSFRVASCLLCQRRLLVRWPPFTRNSCRCAGKRARRERTTPLSPRSGCSTTGMMEELDLLARFALCCFFFFLCFFRGVVKTRKLDFVNLYLSLLTSSLRPTRR